MRIIYIVFSIIIISSVGFAQRKPVATVTGVALRDLVGKWRITAREWTNGNDTTICSGMVEIVMVRDTVRYWRDSTGVEFRIRWSEKFMMELMQMDEIKIRHQPDYNDILVSFTHGFHLNSSKGVAYKVPFEGAETSIDYDNSDRPIQHTRWSLSRDRIRLILFDKNLQEKVRKRKFDFVRL